MPGVLFCNIHVCCTKRGDKITNKKQKNLAKQKQTKQDQNESYNI